MTDPPIAQPYTSPGLDPDRPEPELPRGYGCWLISILLAWTLIGFGIGCAVNLVALLMLPGIAAWQELSSTTVLAIAMGPPLIGTGLGGFMGVWQIKRWRRQLGRLARTRKELGELVQQKSRLSGEDKAAARGDFRDCDQNDRT